MGLERIGMKLCRYGPMGEEKPGVVDKFGVIRDLSDYVKDIGPSELDPIRLAALSMIDPASLPVVGKPARYGVPFSGTRHFLAIGLNYSDAMPELARPAEPAIMFKSLSCIQGSNDPVTIPPNSDKTDWEVEMGVVIGRRASYVTLQTAGDYIAGYCVVHDVCERAYQMERGGTMDKGKGCPTFGPVGPWLVTADEVGDPQNLALWLDVNGSRMQHGNTRQMIFSAHELVAYVSQFMILEPGDIISSGTPSGIGMSQKPRPIFLKDGDVVTLGIEKLGDQRQTFRQWASGK
jgi:2,4-diketo-3-deoxy-L-fuconate hydrolase